MLFGLGVVLGLSVVASSFHVNDVAAQEKSRKLQKRDWVRNLQTKTFI